MISREEFINLVKNLKLPFSATDLNVIWLQLDKSNNGKAYALNFRTLFLPYVEEDLKFMMTTMFRSLDNANMTLPELMKAYTKGPYISFPKLIDAFKYISNYFFHILLLMFFILIMLIFISLILYYFFLKKIRPRI